MNLEGPTVGRVVDNELKNTRLIFIVVISLLGQGTPVGAATITDVQREVNYRRQGIVHYDNASTVDACSTERTIGGTQAPANIPEPMRTTFTEGAAAHGTDVTLLATIYAVENALYHNDAHLGNDWLIARVHANDWRTSGGGAKGPMQFLDGTWGEVQQEGPFIYRDNQWTTERGPEDGISVIHFDDAVFGAADYLKRVGGTVGVPLGSVDQDFPRSGATDSIAMALKNYNAGQGTWREGGVWYYPGNGGPVAWGSAKQGEITGYITLGLEIYTELVGGGQGANPSGCNSIALGDIDIIDMSAQADEWPEFSNRQIMEEPYPTAIALHWTGGNPNQTGQQFIDSIAGREGTCCAVQFFVNASGEIFQLTNPIHEIVGHISQWNPYTIGIEIGAGSDGTVETAEEEINSQTAQQEAVAQLVSFLMNTYSIPAEATLTTTCSGNATEAPVGLIGHINDPCSTKVDPTQEYVDLIRGRVAI